MRIAVISNDTAHGPDDPRRGRCGAAQLVGGYLARALAARGHEVDRISPCPRSLVEAGVRYLPLGAGPGERYDAAVALRHVELLEVVAARRRFAWVHDQHGHSGTAWGRFADARVVVVSQFLRRIVEACAPVRAVVPCGVPDALFELPIEPGTRLYTSGMWVECRGTHVAIDAFERARRRVPELSLDLYGDHELWGSRPGRYAERVRQRAEAVGAAVHGTVVHVDMLAALARLDILVHPATAETCGVAVLEAMAAGNPVVATGHGALREHGLAAHSESAAAMADEIVRLAANADCYGQVAEHNRRMARRYAWSAVAEEWEDVMRDA